MLRAAHVLREFRFAVVIALFSAALAVPVSARAQVNVAAVEKVTGLNKRALDAYNNLEFEDARKLLKQALELCSASGLDKHPIKARTHIHMGVVLIASKQQELGVKQFRKALEIQPDIQVTRSLANPEIMAAFEEASAGGSGTASPSDGRGGPEGRGSASDRPPAREEAGSAAPGIHHSPVSRGKRGSPVTIVATVDPELSGFTKVVLAYRAEGAPEFLPVEMELTGKRYVGQIPEAATRGARVAYYIEAEANDDTAVATIGTEDRPFTVFLTAGRPTRDDTAEGGGSDDERGGPPTQRYFVALLGGTGIGYTTGNGEVNADNKVTAGFAPSTAAHIMPELGYFLNPNWRLSLQLRYQFVSGTTPLYLQKLTPPRTGCGSDNICTPASSAFAAVARSSWFFGAGMLRPYFSLALGAGQIRHVVKFGQSTKNCGAGGNEVCVDTVVAGPVFAGAGGGVMLTLTPMFGLVGEVNSLLGFPNFTAHFDFNLGVAARF